MKKRIWELDAFRGICILGVIAVHFVYDMVELYGLVKWDYPAIFTFIRDWGGVLFLLLSGTCATLGSHSIRRGLIVFGCGLLITAVTAGMYLLKLANISIIIYFGVLHCLGVCMLLWPLFRKFPWWALLLFGGVLTGLGFWLWGLPPVQTYWLMVIGLPWRGFISADYFPLLPFLASSCWALRWAKLSTAARKAFSPMPIPKTSSSASSASAADSLCGCICCISPF